MLLAGSQMRVGLRKWMKRVMPHFTMASLLWVLVPLAMEVMVIILRLVKERVGPRLQASLHNSEATKFDAQIL